ncbi:MarR family winged helix-turn-helix transcriptional regulator [Streptomyces rimosus]|uniref:MarR family winged helix-turn-helix transcriptional regulator n=1 Tax=Streptomyces rimosus TaxID=1927 RepID=UPI0004C06FB6|nr:MarR family transcriptional regulator [Streptomyces rimosus]
MTRTPAADARRTGPEDSFNDRTGHLIKRAEQHLISEKSHVLRTVDLTVPQYVALLVLHRRPGLSGAQLARECMVTAQTMTTVLNNLESKGLITRTTSQVHQKVLVSSLTRSGRSLFKKADKLICSVEGRLDDAFSEEERQQLHSLLERAITALQSD